MLNYACIYTPPAITLSLSRNSYCMTAEITLSLTALQPHMARTINYITPMNMRNLFSKHLRFTPNNWRFTPNQAMAAEKTESLCIVCAHPQSFSHRHCGTAGKLVHAATAALFKQHFLDHAEPGLPDNVFAEKTVSLLSSLARSRLQKQPQLRLGLMPISPQSSWPHWRCN